jgi:hypothetical protein
VQLEFWTAFRQQLLDKAVVQNAQAARPQYWFDVPLGRTGFTLSNFASPTDGRIGTRLYLNNKIADLALAQLLTNRSAIEAEIGEPLQWNPNPGKRDKVIMISRDADLTRKDRWPEYCDLLVDRVAKFRKAFSARVRGLDLTAAQQGE